MVKSRMLVMKARLPVSPLVLPYVYPLAYPFPWLLSYLPVYSCVHLLAPLVACLSGCWADRVSAHLCAYLHVVATPRVVVLWSFFLCAFLNAPLPVH